MNNFLIALIVFILMGCYSLEPVLLENNRTEVPSAPSVYINRCKFDSSLLSIIDSNSVYEEFNQKYNVLSRLDNHQETSFYSEYRFYSNGDFSLFIRNRDDTNHRRDFDTNYQGYRGIYYRQDGKFVCELYGPASERRNLGKMFREMYFDKDTMYYKVKNTNFRRIYIKRSIDTKEEKRHIPW